MDFILRGLNATGEEFFYTGKAGDGWVSQQIGDAFGYATIEAARRKGKALNQGSWAHTLWFIAVPANYRDGGAA